MAGDVLIVEGYREFLRAADLAGREVKTQVRDAFRESGEIVRADASRRLSKYSTRSAAGLKVRVRARGVSVEQSLRKTTGRRPDYGDKVQMKRALIPALFDDEAAIEAEFNKALEKVVRIFNT